MDEVDEVDKTEGIIEVWLVCHSAAGADGAPPSIQSNPKMLGDYWDQARQRP